MPGVAGFNVGRDVTINFVTGGLNGTTLALTALTASEFRPVYDRRVHKGLDGINITLPIPAGWEGTIDLDRNNSVLDDYVAAVESGYYQGQGVALSSITETIQEIDGSVSIFQYTNLTWELAEGGHWRGDNIVSMRITVYASQRQILQ